VKLYAIALRYLLELDYVIICCSKDFNEFFRLALKLYGRYTGLQLQSLIIEPDTTLDEIEHYIDGSQEKYQSASKGAFLVDAIGSYNNTVYLRDEKSAAFALTLSQKIPTHLMFSSYQKGIPNGESGTLEIGIPFSLAHFSFLIWEKGIRSIRSGRYFATLCFEEI